MDGVMVDDKQNWSFISFLSETAFINNSLSPREELKKMSVGKASKNSFE